MQILSAEPYYLIYQKVTAFVKRERAGIGMMIDFQRVTAFDAEIYPVYESLRMRLQHGSP